MSDLGREAGPPSERTRRPGETNAQYNMRQPEFVKLHQLGDCVDCGRNAEHRWHQPGRATLGDGSQPHKYNPTGDPFQSIATSSDTPPKGAYLD